MFIRARGSPSTLNCESLSWRLAGSLDSSWQRARALISLKSRPDAHISSAYSGGESAAQHRSRPHLIIRSQNGSNLRWLILDPSTKQLAIRMNLARGSQQGCTYSRMSQRSTCRKVVEGRVNPRDAGPDLRPR
jgi:hypothetical protein